MAHLKPLPGSPGFAGDVHAVRDAMLVDAQAVVAGGADAIMLENFGDTPFFKDQAPAVTLTHMTALAIALRHEFKLPIGINVLRNDALGALAIAHAAGASFIRVNVLAGARVTDQGVIEGRAAELMRLRKTLDADVLVFADVDVKHSAPLGLRRSLEEETADLVKRAGADAVIVSGVGTGERTNADDIARVVASAGGCPVWVGSGVTVADVSTLVGVSGVIVGASVKVGGKLAAPVDADRVRQLMAALRPTMKR